MGANVLFAKLECPRCGYASDVEVETTIDNQGHARDYRLGDVVDWLPGQRPESGNRTTDGYVVCPVCGKDFFVIVTIESDRVARVEVDKARPGYIR